MVASEEIALKVIELIVISLGFFGILFGLAMRNKRVVETLTESPLDYLISYFLVLMLVSLIFSSIHLLGYLDASLGLVTFVLGILCLIMVTTLILWDRMDEIKYED